MGGLLSFLSEVPGMVIGFAQNIARGLAENVQAGISALTQAFKAPESLVEKVVEYYRAQPETKLYWQMLPGNYQPSEEAMVDSPFKYATKYVFKARVSWYNPKTKEAGEDWFSVGSNTNLSKEEWMNLLELNISGSPFYPNMEATEYHDFILERRL